jgi:hypothetical protein
MREVGDVAARTQAVDGPGHIKPAQKLGSDASARRGPEGFRSTGV